MPTRERANAVDDSSLIAAVDPCKPNIARIYDYFLGGKDNFARDRTEAERMLAIYPALPVLARENRLFLTRAVDWLAAQGIRQFLDVGSGLPTAQNTHQVAQSGEPSSRVMYVDNDPVVVAHAQALLSGDNVAAVLGDVRDPASILADQDVLKLIHLDEPLGLILAMVLHFFDATTASEITAGFAGALAPGSFVVISVGSGDEETGGQLAREYTAATLYNHSPAEITGFFAGLDLTGSGLIDARDWEPDLTAATAAHRGGRILVGVGRKP